MKKILSAVVAMIAGCGTPSQGGVVNGVVVDEHDAGIANALVSEKGTDQKVYTDPYGYFSIEVSSVPTTLIVTANGYKDNKVKVSKISDEKLKVTLKERSSVVERTTKKRSLGKQGVLMNEEVCMDMSATAFSGGMPAPGLGAMRIPDVEPIELNTEKYSAKDENAFKDTQTDPISVFSANVDKASYSNVRRFIERGQRPPQGSVRVEELINYFDYDYPAPKGNDVVSINTEIAACPWNKEHDLLRIGLMAKSIPQEELPASNLVFLIDVSGSMASPNKLPLLVQSMKIMLERLTERDYVSVVTYSGQSNSILEPESCTEEGKQRIIAALDNLRASGFTAGCKGIQMAYERAEAHFIKDGNNRVILATDGDFNIGQSSDGELKEIIEEKKKSGVFLTVLGFGTGNYNDSMMATLSKYGNGNYAYIDNISEAKKVLGTELMGTLYTVAKDVKILVDFNPEMVKNYRLVGYETRMLNNEDFNNDKKDAGDMGCGHKVTALYELVRAGGKSETAETVKSEYTKTVTTGSSDWLTVKFRYKAPGDSTSLLQTHAVSQSDYNRTPSDNFKLAAGVAMFGQILNNSKFVGKTSLDSTVEYLSDVKSDKNGYVDELRVLVRRAKDVFDIQR